MSREGALKQLSRTQGISPRNIVSKASFEIYALFFNLATIWKKILLSKKIIYSPLDNISKIKYYKTYS